MKDPKQRKVHYGQIHLWGHQSNYAQFLTDLHLRYWVNISADYTGPTDSSTEELAYRNLFNWFNIDRYQEFH